MSRRLNISDLLNPIPTVDSLGSSANKDGTTPAPVSVRHNVKLNRKTTLVRLYTYPLGSYVEYPQSSAQGPVGHLFRVDPAKWENPVLNFAYSRGEPSGRTRNGEVVYCEILVDNDGIRVPCQERHTTCT